MNPLPDSVRTILESPALAHLVTLNPDGSPQVSGVWVGLDGDEIVTGHLAERRKVTNVRNDGRVALSIETGNHNARGLVEYLVIYGTARISEGGAPELLQKLAHTYLGQDVRFPDMDHPPAGYITHIQVDRISGVGPWAAHG
ncbi:MAG TPA: PPOX class F420-dependent oxidoreductase [Trebonia sp.]